MLLVPLKGCSSAALVSTQLWYWKHLYAPTQRSFSPQKILLSSLLPQSESTNRKAGEENMIYSTSMCPRGNLSETPCCRTSTINMIHSSDIKHKKDIKNKEQKFSATHNYTWLLHKTEATCIFCLPQFKTQKYKTHKLTVERHEPDLTHSSAVHGDGCPM